MKETKKNYKSKNSVENILESFLEPPTQDIFGFFFLASELVNIPIFVIIIPLLYFSFRTHGLTLNNMV